MNVVLWVIQFLLALHTLIGAIWKFTNPEQAVASLAAIPQGVWLTLAVVEVLLSLGLVVPFFKKRFSRYAPIAALAVAVEMIFFCLIHTSSGATDRGPVIYWLTVALISGSVAFARWKIRPN